MTIFSNEIIQHAHDQAQQAACEEDRLKAEAKIMASTRQLLAELYLYLNKSWPLHILDALSRQSDLRKELESIQPSIFSLLSEISREAENAAQKLEPFPARFPQAINEACLKVGLAIDDYSRHPEYTFEKRFITLKINDAKKTAAISNYESKRKISLPADTEAVIEKLQEERQRLFDRPFDNQAFIRLIRESYKSLLAEEKMRDGSSISIRKIYAKIKGRNAKYASDEFLVDLSRLVDQGSASVNNLRLELQQTKDTKEGMLLLGAGGYTGFIFFKGI